MNIYVAKTKEEVFDLLENGCKVLAGGTNVFVDIKKKGEPDCDFVDISGVEDLKKITETDSETVIGAGVTFFELEKFFKDKKEYNALYKAAFYMGAPQIRNRATIGGNLCDASPACDGAPALSVLDGEVVLESKSGERRVKIPEFFRDFRKTVLQKGELLTAIAIKKKICKSDFVKVGLRSALAISVVSFASAFDGDGAKFAMGSVAPVPTRLYGVEKLVNGNGKLTKSAVASVLDGDISPISDVRASAKYRKQVALNLLVKCLEDNGYEL